MDPKFLTQFYKSGLPSNNKDANAPGSKYYLVKYLSIPTLTDSVAKRLSYVEVFNGFIANSPLTAYAWEF